jgi:transposase
MHPSELVAQEGRRHRRQFSSEFKAEVVASCQQRGVSLAAVARAHDLHPNLLRKWVQEYERFGTPELPAEPAVRRDIAAQFIPLQLGQREAPSPPAKIAQDIHIELQHNGLRASVRWPVSQAQQCAVWLREVMR